MILYYPKIWEGIKHKQCLNKYENNHIVTHEINGNRPERETVDLQFFNIFPGKLNSRKLRRTGKR